MSGVCARVGWVAPGRYLEQVLRRRGYDVEVLNAGVSGFSTAEEYLYLERELFRYDPDVVVLYADGWGGENRIVDRFHIDHQAIASLTALMI